MVHCFFEQSGTFKNEFIKLGIPSEDYDIQNNFGQTDHVVDLFKNANIQFKEIDYSHIHASKIDPSKIKEVWK